MNSVSRNRVFCCDYRKKILQTNQRLRRNNPERCKADAVFAAIPSRSRTSELAARQQTPETRLSTCSGFRHRQARTLSDRLVAATNITNSRQVTDMTMTASRSFAAASIGYTGRCTLQWPVCRAVRSTAWPGQAPSIHASLSMHIYMPRTGCF